MRRLSILLVASLALGACATAPKPLQGEFPSSSPQESIADGSRVRWGGSIIAVEPKQDVTCFQVLSKDLGTNGRPRLGDGNAGRFLACRNGFYDPAVFGTGREITVVGNLSGSETRKIGDYDYPLPRIAADVVYLWPERISPDSYYGPDPFFYPGWYGSFYAPIYWRPHYRHSRHESGTASGG
jgi:outer membrane lipoprotein